MPPMLNVAPLVNAAPLGDKRLKNRILSIIESLVQGQMSVTTGTQGAGHSKPWAHTMASFRFFDNAKLTLSALYAPCLAGIQQLLSGAPRCHIVHDISVVDYSKHQAKQDLVQAGNERGYGYELFTALVLDEKGLPVGPVLQELRTEKGCLSSESVEPLPFVDHLTQAERAVKVSQRVLPSCVRIHLYDREFDDLQLHRFHEDQDDKRIIRCQHLNRQVLVQGQRLSLQQAVAQVTLVPGGHVEREGNSYDLFVGETRAVFDKRSLRGVAQGRQPPQSGRPISVRIVISELRRPGQKTLQWVLLTDLQGDIMEVVQAYVWRWRVERFFYLNKIGFRLEEWRQETGERIARRLAVTQLAAMVIYQMQACAQQPEMGELIKVVATLGGWLGRKGDPIGPIVLMRGMLLLVGMVRALEEFGEVRIREVAQQVMTHLGFRTVGRSP